MRVNLEGSVCSAEVGSVCAEYPLSLSFAGILSETRKYGLSLFLAHQYIEQLQEEVRSAIFGNVGTLICFRVGATDAEFLEKEFQPEFDNNDLIRLSKFNIYLTLMIDGISSIPFSAKLNTLIKQV